MSTTRQPARERRTPNGTAALESIREDSARRDRRLERQRQQARRRVTVRRRRRRAVLGALLVLLAFPTWSYVQMLSQPSSLPWTMRTVEWIRQNGGAGVISQAERWYYTWTAPAKGGPTLRRLPTIAGTAATAATARAKALGYRPARIRPVLHPGLPGEGIWHGTGRMVRGASPILVTDYRPLRDYPRVVAYVSWIDHTRTSLALYPGRYEPPIASPRGSMEVPQGQRSKLLAAFNSGFAYKDSGAGFSINGQQYEPLRAGQATLVARTNGTVDIRSWNGGPVPGAGTYLAKQNLPLIVDHGRPNPNLNDGPQWGATLGNAILVWRSGVGIDRHGNLIYAAADYLTVAELAQILIHAGAVRGMQLDINAEWPTFNWYGAAGTSQPSKLVPNSMQSSQRYLVPDDRDFFAVYSRWAGPVAGVPLH